jgi:hypothetical protein
LVSVLFSTIQNQPAPGERQSRTKPYRDNSEAIISAMSDTTLPNGEKRAVDPAFYNNNTDASPDYRARDSINKPEESRLENGEGPQILGEVDRATERRIIRKIDKRIVPMVMWVYLMNMMDRGKLLI